MSESSKSNPNRRVKRIAIILVVLGVAIWAIFRIDKNPEISYSPTDGKAMVLDLQERLKANEGLDNTYLPVETDAQFKMPVPLFTATIVNYEKPKAIGIVRWLAGLIHIPVQGGHLNFSRADYAMVGDLKSSTTMMSTFLESRTQHVQNSRNFPQEPYFGEEIKKESDALKNLEPNGKLRLHSDFIIIQFNGQCRVYLLDKLPSNMRRIAEREQEKMAARPIL